MCVCVFKETERHKHTNKTNQAPPLITHTTTQQLKKAHRLERRAPRQQLVREHADAPAVDLVGVPRRRVGLVVGRVRLDGAVEDLRRQVVDRAEA